MKYQFALYFIRT